MFTLVAASMLALAQQPGGDWTHLSSGVWDAWLDTPGGKLDCPMILRNEGDKTSVEFLNAAEHVVVPKVEWNREKRTLDLEFPHYDSRISATASADGWHLDGQWSKRSSSDRWTTLDFHALGVDGDLKSWVAAGDALTRRVSKWQVNFESSPESAVLVLERAGDLPYFEVARHDRATFLTTTGDYRFLSGRRLDKDNVLTLQCFDGAHAFLFTAKLLNGSTLEGDFWSGDSWHETWTAVRDDNAQLPDPFELTKANAGAKLDALAFPDLHGKQRSLTEFAGKPRVVVLFGSWCPNCNDEAAFLREIDERYRTRGLSLLGLAFELTGDMKRDAGQVKLFAERHKLSIPLFVAGLSDKAEASKTFPLLDKIRAYPTTLFVRRDGTIRAVHQGYSGPATGAEHTKLREDFERLINELLAESDSKK